MKKIILGSLIGLALLLNACGEDTENSSSTSSNSSNRNASNQEVIDITNRSFDFTGGIEANTGETYRFKQEDIGYSMKWLTISNSATKECSLKIINRKADWSEEMDERFQYGSVFNIKSSDDRSVPYRNGVYVFPYSSDDYTFLIYFASGGSNSNFVDFTINCKNGEE